MHADDTLRHDTQYSRTELTQSGNGKCGSPANAQNHSCAQAHIVLPGCACCRSTSGMHHTLVCTSQVHHWYWAHRRIQCAPDGFATSEFRRTHIQVNTAAAVLQHWIWFPVVPLMPWRALWSVSHRRTHMLHCIVQPLWQWPVGQTWPYGS
jgi:hypothetical protein